jgi:hypothetical protein
MGQLVCRYAPGDIVVDLLQSKDRGAHGVMLQTSGASHAGGSSDRGGEVIVGVGGDG